MRFFLILAAAWLWVAPLAAQTTAPGIPPHYGIEAGHQFPPQSGAAAPSMKWVNFSNTSFLSSTSVNIGFTNANTTCGTISAGDFLLAELSVSTGASAVSWPPTGFTALGSPVTDGSGNIVQFASKIAAGTETCSGSTLSASWTGAVQSAWLLADYGGAKTAATPVDGSNVATYTAGSSTSVTVNGITPASSPDLLILLFMASTHCSGTCTLPTGFTLRGGQAARDTNPVDEFLLGDMVLNASGATGNYTVTTDAAFSVGAYGLIAITHP